MRICTARLLLACALIAPTPALAQRAAPATDAQTLAACLKRAHDAGEFGAQCIGTVADPCISTAMKQRTYWEDSKACAQRELVLWTDLLQKAVRSVEKSAEKAIRTNVVAAQKAWQLSREKLCPIFDGLDPGMVPGGANYCRLQETARRVLSLQRLGAALGEH